MDSRNTLASELFNISRNTINLWLKRKAETGDVQALPNRPPVNNHKITDWEEFRAFAKTHGDIAIPYGIAPLHAHPPNNEAPGVMAGGLCAEIDLGLLSKPPISAYYSFPSRNCRYIF